MAEPQLVDVVPEYPANDDSLLAAKIVADREFAQLQEPFARAPNPFADVPKTLLYNHQETVVRYFAPITGKDRGAIIHDPGLGKTPTAVVLCEQACSKEYRAFVLTQNNVMENNFKETIVKYATGRYAPAAGDVAAAAAAASSSATNKPTRGAKIGDYYQFATYETFSKELLSLFDARTGRFTGGGYDFVEQFRGRRIVMDESHHIRATRQAQESKAKKGKGRGRGAAEKEPKQKITNEALEAVCGKGRASWMNGVRQTYRAFFLFLHLIKDCSIFLLTATPMVDRKTEFCFQMNLLLPPEKLYVSGSSSFTEFDQLSDEELLKSVYDHCAGMISYARSNYRARRIDEGEAIGPQLTGAGEVDFITRFVACPMSKEQYDVVRAIEVREGGGIDADPEAYGVDEDDENSFKHLSRAASCMIVPYGADAKGRKLYYAGNEKLTGTADKTTIFQYYFEQRADKKWALRSADKGTQHERDVTELRRLMRDRSAKGLRLLSSKYAYVLDVLSTDVDDPATGAPNRLVTYVYSPLLKGSGLIPLMVAMTENGYQQLDLSRGRADEIVQRLLTENAEALRQGRPVPRRVTLISSGASSAEVRLIKKVLNHEANARGALIHVVLGSPSSGESISFHHVRRFIEASPTWNKAQYDQALGRCFRIDSHLHFKPADAFVRVLNLAATTPPEVEARGGELPVPTDIQILQLAEMKGRRNGGVYRAAKQCSFDGLVNR
jgi:hypothetical protein